MTRVEESLIKLENAVDCLYDLPIVYAECQRYFNEINVLNNRFSKELECMSKANMEIKDTVKNLSFYIKEILNENK